MTLIQKVKILSNHYKTYLLNALICDLSSNSHRKVQNECLRVKSLKFALRPSEKQLFRL